MAILRSELKGNGSASQHRNEAGDLYTKIHGVYEGIVETTNDLSLPRTSDFDAGSILLCLENHKLYVKNSLGQWTEVTA